MSADTPLAESPPPKNTSAVAGPRLAAMEVLWIFLMFFLLAGSQPPDVGEAHYLAKARHYWDSTWCAGDLFLESQDAHWTFYWTFGWVTQFFSLTASAWIGRVAIWGLLAWSWQRLSWAVVPRPLWSLLSAGLLLLLLRNFHLAGEWVVGGVEAKGLAYVLVFLSLEAIVRDRWSAALWLAGGAGALHVLVGGWTAVAIGLAWLFAGSARPKLISLIPAAIGGLLLAAPGLIPAIALNAGVPAEISREASRIYVFERLAHHLVFHRFDAWNQVRFGLLMTAWLPVAWSLRREAGLWRMQLVVAGALLIGLVGVLVDQAGVLAVWGGETLEGYQLRAAPFLRFYWFRFSDSLLPVGMSLGICWWIGQWHASRPQLANWLLMGAMLAAAGNVADVCYWRRQQPLPGAIIQPRPTPDATTRWWFSGPSVLEAPPNSTTAEAWMADWQATCAWIDANTPRDAVFVTPRDQQTFKWYAQRAEVANRKDVPQDAGSLVEWRRRLELLYPHDRRHHELGLAAHTDEQLIALARQFSAPYIVVDRTRSQREILLPQVYPLMPGDNPSFAVYRVPGEREASASR